MTAARWTPFAAAASVAVLLGLALAAPALRAAAPRPALDVEYDYLGCDIVQSGTTSLDHPLLLHPGEGVVQPINTNFNVAACSVHVNYPLFTTTQFEVVYWDDSSLLPDPTTVRLRSATFPATSVPVNQLKVGLNPSAVLLTVAGLADPPPARAAVIYRNMSSHDVTAYYEPDGPASAPVGYALDVASVAVPLSGPHPVLAHAICGGDEALQRLRVVQSVNTTDAETDPGAFEVIQKFRLPIGGWFAWANFGVGEYVTTGVIDNGRLRIFDAAGQSVPPATWGTPLYDQGYSPPHPAFPWGWQSHWPPAGGPNLQPARDYWLVVTTHSDFTLNARMKTGNEGPDFAAGVGGLFTRTGEGGAVTEVPDRTLSFRIVAEPLTLVDVPGPTPADGRLELTASPNPSRGPVSVAWAGARGQVRFEVLDARGRRVAGDAPGIGASGVWRWNARSLDGRELSPGVYFIRARDSAGRETTARLTRVR